jgi:hypothetical protein
MFRQSFFGLVAALLAAILIAPAALAANPHFVVDPTFTVNANGTVTATGSVAGLGNQNIDVVLTAELNVEVLCRNPGGNIAPGQTQQTTVTGTQTNIEVKNGRASFDVTTAAPALDPTRTPKQLGCPNNKWTPEIGEVTVVRATLQIIQPAGSGHVVLEETFTP